MVRTDILKEKMFIDENNEIGKTRSKYVG